MVTVLHGKFLKLFEFTKKDDKSKFYKITVLYVTDNTAQSIDFFINNQIALNLKNIEFLQNVAVSFDIWFSADGTMRYKITNVVIEK